MAWVRILVDGYSLLHHWPELAPGKPRHSAAARDELLHHLRQFQDATQTPITVVFDGARAPKGTPPPENSSSAFEILYAPEGKTADDLIERAACRLAEYGQVLVVTNDHAERNAVEAAGALASSCESFIQEVALTLGDLARDIDQYNRRERRLFQRPRN
jgi:uncharacterized protein